MTNDSTPLHPFIEPVPMYCPICQEYDDAAASTVRAGGKLGLGDIVICKWCGSVCLCVRASEGAVSSAEAPPSLDQPQGTSPLALRSLTSAELQAAPVKLQRLVIEVRSEIRRRRLAQRS